MKVKLLIILLFVISACEECRYANCPTKYDGIQFSLVSKTGKDLLCGSTKRYEVDQIGVFSLNDEGKKVYSPISVELKTETNSVVAVILASDKQAFLEVTNVVTDTMKFEFRANTSKCCGTYAELTKVFLNNRLICEDNSLFVIKER